MIPLSAVILIIIVLFLLFYLAKILTNDYDVMKRLPGPKRYPIIGNLPVFVGIKQDGVFDLMRQLSKTYGTFCLWSMGIGHVHNSRAREAEILLSSSRHSDKSAIYKFLKDFLGTGLLISNGLKWQQRRKMLTPAFHFNILQQFAGIFNEESHKVVQMINKKVDLGEDVLDISTISCRFTLNIICETAMGVKLDALNDADEYRSNIYKVAELVVHRTMRPWLYVDALFKMLGYQRQVDKHVEQIHGFTRGIINKRRQMFYENQQTFEDLQNENIYETKKRRYAMLDTLLSNEANGRIDEEGICEEVDTFMFEGHDTTSSGITFSLLLIASHPEIQDQLYEEIKDAVDRNNGAYLSLNQFSELPFFDRVLKECLRIYSPVTFISRTTTEDMEFHGVDLKAGNMLHLHILDVHRDPEFWPDPEKFDADRFLPENVVARNPYAYVPFSAGPRNCIGQKFAVLEMKTVIHYFVMNFKMTAVTRREDIKFVADLVLRAQHPILIKFEKRIRPE